MIVSLALLGPDNVPFFHKTFPPPHNPTSIPTPLRLLFLLHSSLDHIEERINNNNQRNVGNNCWFVCPVEGYRVYGYRTNGGVKIIVVVEDAFGRVGKNKVGGEVATPGEMSGGIQSAPSLGDEEAEVDTSNTSNTSSISDNNNHNVSTNSSSSTSLSFSVNVEKHIGQVCNSVHDLYVQEAMNPFNELGRVGGEGGRFHKGVAKLVANYNNSVR